MRVEWIAIALLSQSAAAASTPSNDHSDSLASRLITVDPDTSLAEVERLLQCRITVADDQICATAPTDSLCYPAVVDVPPQSNVPVPVRWGQSVPGGMHVSMDFDTGVRTVSRLAEDKTATGAVALHAAASDEPMTSLQLQKKPMSRVMRDALTAINTDDTAADEHNLATLQDMVHGYSDGEALACNGQLYDAPTVGAMDLIQRRFFHHPDATVRRTAALAVAYAFENNADSKRCFSAALFDVLLHRIVTDADNRDAWLLALGGGVHGSKLGIDLLLKPLHGSRLTDDYRQMTAGSLARTLLRDSELGADLQAETAVTPLLVLGSMPGAWRESSRFEERLVRLLADTFRQLADQHLKILTAELGPWRLWCFLLQQMSARERGTALFVDIEMGLGALVDMGTVSDDKEWRVCWITEPQLGVQQ